MRLSVCLCLTILCALMVAGVAVAEPKSDGELRVERLRAERIAQAEPTRLVVPHFSTANLDRTTLYLINKIDQPLQVEVSALDDAGNRHPLGRHLLEPNRHTTISLNDGLSDIGYQTGSLRVDYLGDPEMVQSWAVLQRGRQVVELPLTPVGDAQVWQRLAFWDARQFGAGVKPTFYVVNGSDVPMSYKLRMGHGQEAVHVDSGVLAAGARDVVQPLDIDPTLDRGWLWLEVEGQGGTMTSVGVLEGNARRRAGHLSRINVEPSLITTTFSQFSSLAVPLVDARRVPLSLFNGDEEPAIADVVVLELESGRELARHAITIPAGGVDSVDLAAVTRSAARELPAEVRVRVDADRPLRLWSAAELTNGDVLEVALFGVEQAHRSGLYPLPSLDRHEVVNTMVNLGDQLAIILGQISWNGGTYALEPIEIPAGESRRIDFAEIVAAGKADLLERKVDANYRDGFFQWAARGEAAIIARTDVRPLEGSDRFGFNCGSCCFSSSFGDLLPGSVVVDLSTSTGFDGVEKIASCSGTLGPYTISSFNSLSYSSPLSWNGHTVSSATPTDQNASFTAWGDEVDTDGYDCITYPLLFGDDGDVAVDDCQQDHNPPPFNPAQSCASQNSTCPTCFSCCNDQKKVGDCRCDKLLFGVATCKAGVKAACGTCKQTCAGSLFCGGNLNC